MATDTSRAAIHSSTSSAFRAERLYTRPGTYENKRGKEEKIKQWEGSNGMNTYMDVKAITLFHLRSCDLDTVSEFNKSEGCFILGNTERRDRWC